MWSLASEKLRPEQIYEDFDRDRNTSPEIDGLGTDVLPVAKKKTRSKSEIVSAV